MVLFILKNTIPQALFGRQGRLRILSIYCLDHMQLLTSDTVTSPISLGNAAPARYTANPSVAEGWHLRQVTAPSRLFGANGLRTGPDGRVYVAQVTGSQISALDIVTGELQTVAARGGDIIAPDDVAFDIRGNLYATEVMDGRVSVREPNGTTRVLRDDVRRPTASRSTRAGCSSANAAKADGFSSSTWPADHPVCCWRTCRHPTPWRSAPTGCSTSR